MNRRTGIWLVVVAFGLLLYTVLASPAYARAHPHLAPALVTEFVAPWPLALGAVLSVVGIVLALVPIRHGERWAVWTCFGMLSVLFVTRITSDPRCLVVLDPHQHGCHTFMIAVVLGVVGLALARFAPN